mgnify:CR=1 FL=1
MSVCRGSALFAERKDSVKLTHLTPADYVTSAWSGGKTIQIAIGPAGAVYANRDFLWRLSSATVDLEESDFTALPDYSRLIAPLRGEMRLSHNGGPAVELAPYQVHAFDGADATHSWGRCTDFNLMLRKGVCEGSVAPVLLSEGECLSIPAEGNTVILYCAEGNAAVRAGGSQLTLRPGEAALLTDAAGTVLTAENGPASLMAAHIRA